MVLEFESLGAATLNCSKSLFHRGHSLKFAQPVDYGFLGIAGYLSMSYFLHGTERKFGRPKELGRQWWWLDRIGTDHAQHPLICGAKHLGFSSGAV